MQKNIVYILIVTGLLIGSLCFADDWPQFRGPNRDGKSAETGLLKRWPAGGPRLLWSVSEDLGIGYSSAVIVDGLVYVTGMREKKGVLFAHDLNGNLKWQKIYGPEWNKTWPGTRSAPTINDEKIYIFSGVGVIYCYESKSGDLVWSRDVVKDYEGLQTEWGWAESLLVFEDKVICTPGGKRTTMVAMDKNTGKVIWDKPYVGEQHAYCSPILIERGSKKIVINRTEHIFFGVNGENGEILWTYDCKEAMKPAKPPQIHPNNPLYRDGFIYITSGYDAGGFMFDVSKDGSAIELKWLDKTLDVFHGGVVLVGDFIYGSNFSRKNRSEWVSLNWNSGKPEYIADWNQSQGAILYADDRLYCYDEKTGELALVKVGSEFEVISSLRIPKSNVQSHWAHPSISDGKLFVRHGNRLWCYDIKADGN